MSDNVHDLVDSLVREAEKVVVEISPHLGGKGSALQAAVLASLTAKWVAGHIVNDELGTEEELHAQLLEQHVDCVRQLIPLEAETRKRRTGR